MWEQENGIKFKAYVFCCFCHPWSPHSRSDSDNLFTLLAWSPYHSTALGPGSCAVFPFTLSWRQQERGVGLNQTWDFHILYMHRIAWSVHIPCVRHIFRIHRIQGNLELLKIKSNGGHSAALEKLSDSKAKILMVGGLGLLQAKQKQMALFPFKTWINYH